MLSVGVGQAARLSGKTVAFVDAQVTSPSGVNCILSIKLKTLPGVMGLTFSLQLRGCGEAKDFTSGASRVEEAAL